MSDDRPSAPPPPGRSTEEQGQRLADINRLLATCNACKRIFLTSDDEQQALDAVCHALVESGEYRMAWIGFAEHDAGRRVRPVAQYGFEAGYLEEARISWSDNERGRGPTGTAIRTHRAQLANDILHDPHFLPWREAAMQRGYAASAAFPIMVEGRAVGALNLYSSHPFAFQHEEYDLLKELADSLAAQLHTTRLRAEREQALAQVAHLNRRNALILEAAGEGIFGLDRDGRITFVNPAAARLTGWEADEMVGLDYHQLGHCRDTDGKIISAAACPILAPLRDGVARSEGSGEFQRRDRTRFPVTFVSTPIIENDRVNGAVVVFRDTSTEREMELARRASEARLRDLVGGATDAFLIYNRDGLFVDVNPAACEGLGYRHEELIGLAVSEVEVEGNDIQRTLAVLERGEPLRREGHYRRRDGSTFPVEVSLSLLVGGTEPLILAVARDVTERKRADERLAGQLRLQQSLIDTFPGPLAYKFADNRFHGCNRAFEEAFKIPRDAIIGKGIADIFPPPMAEAMEAQDSGLLRRGGMRRDEFSLPFRDGTNHDAVLVRATFPAEDGSVGGIVGVALDISELKQTQRALEELNVNLEERVNEEVAANREKERLMFHQARYAQMGEMLSMIAHQWRQPLNAVSAAAIELSLKGDLGRVEAQDIDAFTAFIERQTQNMSATIDDFMDFFRPERSPERFSPHELVEEMRRLMGAQLESRGIVLINAIDPKQGVSGYRKELEQVLLNLVANARDAYGRPGDRPGRSAPREIRLHAAVGGSHITLWVQDHAGGINEEVLPRIFDPYFTTKEPGQGTGIGLYIAKTIVERRFDGTLTVENREGGSRFTLRLPWLEEE